MKNFLNKLRKQWNQLKFQLGFYERIPDDYLIDRYKTLGIRFGCYIFDRFMAGCPVDYPLLLDRLIAVEYEVVARGYRSVPILMFTGIGNKKDLIVPRLEQNERIIRFASLWKRSHRIEDIYCGLFEPIEKPGKLKGSPKAYVDIFAIEKKVLALGPKQLIRTS